VRGITLRQNNNNNNNNKNNNNNNNNKNNHNPAGKLRKQETINIRAQFLAKFFFTSSIEFHLTFKEQLIFYSVKENLAFKQVSIFYIFATGLSLQHVTGKLQTCSKLHKMCVIS
jgi:hypothetical protein